MVRNEIIEVLRRYFVALESVGIQVGFGVLFGSHARGESTGSSDIDVIVVSSVFDTVIFLETTQSPRGAAPREPRAPALAILVPPPWALYRVGGAYGLNRADGRCYTAGWNAKRGN